MRVQAGADRVPEVNLEKESERERERQRQRDRERGRRGGGADRVAEDAAPRERAELFDIMESPMPHSGLPRNVFSLSNRVK